MGYTTSVSSSYTSLAVYDQIITAMTGKKFNNSTGSMDAVTLFQHTGYVGIL